VKVLLIDNNSSRRERIGELVTLIGKGCETFSANSLADLDDVLANGLKFDLALVGPDLPETLINAVRYLRKRFEDSLVGAYDSFLAYDEMRLRRILAAGANMVFDERMAPLKIALLLKPMLVREESQPAMQDLLTA
jgi:hypothetical protein